MTEHLWTYVNLDERGYGARFYGPADVAARITDGQLITVTTKAGDNHDRVIDTILTRTAYGDNVAVTVTLLSNAAQRRAAAISRNRTTCPGPARRACF